MSVERSNETDVFIKLFENVKDVIVSVMRKELFSVAKPARQFSHAMQIFYFLKKQSFSKEMNKDNDLKFAYHDYIVGLASSLIFLIEFFELLNLCI